ncbi:hypothetical protein BHM03_00056237 [Ensete ventricosum]|nr:hypothetical protein BHM03_00056237 [Ensete ventricosum]
MKAAMSSRGSKKQGSSGGGRCGSKDGRGGWAALEGAETIVSDLQAGKRRAWLGGNSNNAAIEESTTSMFGAIDGAVVVDGNMHNQRVAAMTRGGNDEGLATVGYALPRVGRRQWQGGTGGRQHRGVWQRSARLGAMGTTSAGSEGRKGEQGNDRREVAGDND